MTFYEKISLMPKPAYFVLIDPDKTAINEAIKLSREAEIAGVNALLLGGSILLDSGLDDYIIRLKKETCLPVIIFPGILNTISVYADALLFLCMLSSRNPQLLIGEQVRVAPLIRKHNVEAISTAYLLIESGSLTTVQYVSNSLPIPANKPDLVAVHAMAAEYMGMKLVYLEAGSGALHPVPDIIISAVKKSCDLPVIVGGGIRSAETALEKVKAGADIIVTGTVIETDSSFRVMREISSALRLFREEKQRN